jgi:hypothetical protein
MGYNLEANDLEDIKITDPEELERSSRENIYLISSLQGGLIYNSTDDLIDPGRDPFSPCPPNGHRRFWVLK